LKGAGLIGAIVQALPGHQNEIDQMIQMGGEALVATISQRVESVDEVCLFLYHKI